MEQKDEFFHLLMEINIQMRAMSEALCKTWGITSVEGRLLAAIEDRQDEGMIQREAAQRAHMKPSAVTRLIGGLEERGLLVRAEDPDNARQKLLFLTEQGHKIVSEFRREVNQTFGKTLDVLSDEEHTQLLDMLRRIANSLDNARTS